MLFIKNKMLYIDVTFSFMNNDFYKISYPKNCYDMK